MNDFTLMSKAIGIGYGLITVDIYPESMIPSLTVSYWYLFYFLPYIVLTMFLLVPIPVAICYEEFKVKFYFNQIKYNII